MRTASRSRFRLRRGFLTYGKLALPSAGGPCLELRGKATPEMAQRYDVWTYGTLAGFDAEAWTFRPAANVTRCRIRHDESEKTIYLTCRYRTGFTLLLR